MISTKNTDLPSLPGRLLMAFTILMLFGTQGPLAQTYAIQFDLINGMNGIFLGKINSMTQDREGAMWFSDQTNGCITRFDGSRMNRFQHDPLDTNTLGGNYPECLGVDSNGMLWIGFWGFGLDRFDPGTNAFTHYRHDPNDVKSISSDTVNNILVDHLNNIWIGTTRGLDLFDPGTGTFTRFKHDTADPGSLTSGYVRALYEDRQGTIWVGTGFVWSAEDSGGLNRLDRKTGMFKRFLHDPSNANSLVNNKVRAIYEDSRGTLWIGTMGDGLHALDRTTGIIERHPYDPSHPGKLSRPPVKDQWDHITFIQEDAEKCLWIGTLSNGLVRYDPRTGSTRHFISSVNDNSGFKDNSGWAGFASTGGWIWITTQESHVYRVNLYSLTVEFNRSLGNVYYSLLEADKGIQWITADKGLLRKELGTGSITVFRNDPQDPKSISNSWPRKIYRDPDGVIWLGTDGGLNRYHEKTKTFTRFTMNALDSTSLAWNTISDLYTDSHSNFWVSTLGGGLHLMNKEKGTFQRFRWSASDTTSIAGDNVTATLESDDNCLWIGSWDDRGVSRMDIRTKKCRRYLPGVSVISIQRDRKGVLWVAGTNRLFTYEPEADTFKVYKAGGLPLIINEARDMILDSADNLWIFSISGVIRINAAKDQYIVYGKKDGFEADDYPYKSANLLSNGQIVTGAFAGYTAFRPDRIIVPEGRQRLYLGDLYVNGHLVRPRPRGILSATLDHTDEIRLSHAQDVFSISFGSIDFSPEGSKYYYKLDNYDKDWQAADQSNQLYYFNIPPGRYTLRINSTNPRYGTWVERDLVIIVAPPWWKSWWAYSLLGLALAALVVAIHRYQKAQVLKAERERTRAHELAQAREIERAYHDLKTTQAQLIQAEKMASLGEMTAGIAHEIQNPLNFVNNFADLNQELLAEMKEDLSKQRIDEAIQLAGQVIDNEGKIAFHGRRADAIVKSMLQHSRASSGKKEPTDINVLVDEYLRLAYHGLRAKDKSFNAHMVTDLDPGLPQINVVPQDIGRVVLNLVNNAFQAVAEKRTASGPDYSPEVTVSTSQQDDRVSIRISDNGPGIPASIADKIFQPFFTTKPPGQGTGLGLSLSYDIVKAHDGLLRVETAEGTGTTFIIELPISEK